MTQSERLEQMLNMAIAELKDLNICPDFGIDDESECARVGNLESICSECWRKYFEGRVK